MEMRMIKIPIKREALMEIAKEGFGDMVKAVVDVERGVMAIGGELHADGETLLIEKEEARREHLWGINLYPEKSGEDWIEFNSMINIKPALGNRSRGVDDAVVRQKIEEIVGRLIID